MTLGGKSHADQLPLFGPIRTSGYVRLRTAVKESQTSNALIPQRPDLSAHALALLWPVDVVFSPVSTRIVWVDVSTRIVWVDNALCCAARR